ncbi:MAG: hypothetical protein JXB29_03190 [Sedimentisphaerales bacterium]|nr:hypothetical protein [Sedimentisphaerales bacterium]
MKKLRDLGGNWDTDFTGQVVLQAKNEQMYQSKTLHVEKMGKKWYEIWQKLQKKIQEMNVF